MTESWGLQQLREPLLTLPEEQQTAKKRRIYIDIDIDIDIDIQYMYINLQYECVCGVGSMDELIKS